MRKPSLLAGIAFAFAIAVFALPMWSALNAALPYPWAFRTTVIIPYLAYTVYLLATTRRRIGNLTLSVTNLAIAIGLLSLPTSNSVVSCVLVALVTLNRSLLFHRSMVSIALDVFVSAAGLSFAGYLFTSTWSMAAALWGYFLLQSVFVMIPARFSETSGFISAGVEDPVDPFQHSRRQAQAALQRLVQNNTS